MSVGTTPPPEAPEAPQAEPPADPPPPPPPRPPHATATYYRAPRPRRRWLGVALWVAWAVGAAVIAVAVSAVLFLDETLQRANPDTPLGRAAAAATDPVLPGQPVSILLIGSDRRPGRSGQGDAGRSDSLILVRMDSRRGFISMLSFPRDLYVRIPGAGEGKINSAYSIGGPAKTIQTVKALTGQRINYYLNVDFQGFVRLVDHVGGVYIDVDRRYFNDNSHPGPEGTYAPIDLQPGYQRLDGTDALAYVRYRHTDSDFARIARQQQFLSELKRQTGRFGNLLDITSLGRLFSDTVQTNLRSVGRLLSLAELAFTADKDRIARVSVTGYLTMRDGASVVVARRGEVRAKVHEWLDPAFVTPSTAAPIAPSAVSIDVLNGTGRIGAGEGATTALRGRGFEAHFAGAARRASARSVVYYAAGQLGAARTVAPLLGPGTDTAPLPRGTAGGHDLTVVVGRRYRGTVAPRRAARARAHPQTVTTGSLVEVLKPVQRFTGLRVSVPTKVAAGSSLRIRRAYRIDTGASRGPWSVKLVFEMGYHHYWGIEETAMTHPPILEGRTGAIRRNGREYWTYYDGRNLQRLAWREGDTWCWISNTLDNRLSADTMHAIARSARPLGQAHVPSRAAAISLDFDGATP
jgi:LCP family protein required for cell wall assembly